MNQQNHGFGATTAPYQSDSINQLTKNKVLRNTYALLSLNLVFAAVVAYVSLSQGWPYPGMIVALAGIIGLPMLVNMFRNSAMGVAMTFVFTGFLGYMLGPILARYLSLADGPMIVTSAFAGTAAIFAGLTMYAFTTKRDFSGFLPYLVVGVLTAFVLGILAAVFNLGALSLLVSAAFMVLSSGLIIWQTQQIVNGGETNYIMATTTLFVSIFNLFTSLLSLLGFANND
jgi:modulator of FtsH protease